MPPFQSPLCRGGSSDELAVMALQDRARVSIPSVSGRVFRLSVVVRANAQHYVSIPSVSGRVFRHGECAKRGKQAPSFNPLCVGAGLQTVGRNRALRARGTFQSPLCRGGSSDAVHLDGDGGEIEFQSPLCRGGSSDGPEGLHHGTQLPVSIPSVSGRVFRHNTS